MTSLRPEQGVTRAPLEVSRVRGAFGTRDHAASAEKGSLHPAPPSVVDHIRSSQSSSPPVTNASTSDSARMRSTCPGASVTVHESPRSLLTHTVPGRRQVPESATHTASSPAAATTRVNGTTSTSAGEGEGDAEARPAGVVAVPDAAEDAEAASETAPATSAGTGRSAQVMRTASTTRSAPSPTTGATLRSSIGTACQNPGRMPTPEGARRCHRARIFPRPVRLR